MDFVVLDTDVLASASPGHPNGQTRRSWRLLQCLVNECYFLLVSPGLWQEYKKIPILVEGRRKLSTYAFAKIEMVDEPQDRKAWERLKQLRVDEKDIEWILLAAKHRAVFITREKYAPKRRKSAKREQEHQRVARAVEDEFGVRIWHPDYAFRRLCSKSSRKQG